MINSFKNSIFIVPSFNSKISISLNLVCIPYVIGFFLGLGEQGVFALFFGLEEDFKCTSFVLDLDDAESLSSFAPI